MEIKPIRICIVGAGMVGLSTAINIFNLKKKIELTIVANEFYDKTTSFVAAGLFKPEDYHYSVETSLLKQWISDGFKHFSEISRSSDSKVTGISDVSGYLFYKDANCFNRPSYADYVYNFRELNEIEVERVMPKCIKDYKFGVLISTVLIDPSHYLKYLENILRKKGTTFVQKKLYNFNEIADDFDLIVNCSGLGSQILASDKDIHPVKGHVIKVKAPWIRHFIYADSFYAIPGHDFVTVGGIREANNYDLTAYEETTKEIWNNALNYLPSLAGAEIVRIMTGLRPTKQHLTVELSNQKLGKNKNCRLIHNYGHGANGISLSWGTAMHAVGLIKQLYNNESKL